MDVIGYINGVDEINDVNHVRDAEQRLRIYNERMDPFISYSNRLFKKKYRFSKIEFEELLGLIGQRIHVNNGNRGLPISVELQVLACLRLFAKGTYQDCGADIHGFSQPTMSRILRKISVALAGLKDQYIKFPVTPQEENREMVKFFNIARCPRVIGAIDCTHIRITNPGGPYAAMYINRKNFYSLNVQIISNAECKITNIVARWRGSAHDSRIFQESLIKTRFDNNEFQGILLGDNGYPCLQYLFTPVLNPQTPAEEAYNASHISTRNTVERLFGIWKMTFRALYRGITAKLDTAKIMIVAMAVLHNIRRNMRDDDSETDSESDSDIESGDDNHDHEDNIQQPVPRGNIRGNIARQVFINENFQ